MSYIAFIRHGESEGNAAGLMAGGKTDVVLTVNGHKQAIGAGKALQDIKFHHIYTSSLKRTHETAEGVMDGIGYKIPMSHHRDLNERYWGEIEGRRVGDHAPYSSEEAETWFSWGIPAPAGESYADTLSRSLPFFHQEILPAAEAGKNIIVVSHNGVLKTLRTEQEGAEKEKLHDFSFQNGEIVLYEVTEDEQFRFIENRLPNLEIE